MTTVKDIYDYIDGIAPFENMEEWDNSGLLVGNGDKQVRRVVMSLDASAAAADFAGSVDAQLLLTHHPLIFNPLKRIEKGTAVYELVSRDIAVISAHTSFDKAKGGINDNLASLLELEDTFTLENGYVTVGRLKEPMSVDDFALFVCEVLETRGMRYTDSEKLISRVAVGGGACSEFIPQAMEYADCFVTADVKYHEMLTAAEQGFAVINAGHFETENKPFLMLKQKLEEAFYDVEFLTAPIENPVMEL